MATGTLSANGDTNEHTGEKIHVHLSGTFGSGTLTLYFKDENGNWKAIANGALTAAADKILNFPFPTIVKGTLSGATAPSLYYNIRG